MIWRLALTAVALPGLIGGANLSLAELASGDVCPGIAGVPACYVVFAAYTLIVLSAWAPARMSTVLFLLGFFPAFGLAATGVTGEIIGGMCVRRAPRTYRSVSCPSALRSLPSSPSFGCEDIKPGPVRIEF